MEFSKMLQPMKKSAIHIRYDDVTETDIPVGNSKIGGKPDLPSDFEWYYFRGASYESALKNRPLSFLAQINCEEARKYDKTSLLPPKGMLYFFYEMATMNWGFDPEDKGCAKVYYFSGDISKLSRTDFPSDLLDEYKLPEIPLAFSTGEELPDFEEFIQLHEGFEYSQWDEYNEAKNTIVAEIGEDEKISKLLGYANLIQGGMLLECELVSNGVYTGNGDGYANITELQKENAKKWQLLFQFDSIQNEKHEILWGDVGRLYFYINIDDLKALDFSKCCLVLQCY